jgi:phosphoribosyl 1,2-cyclic phosphodiesterase
MQIVSLGSGSSGNAFLVITKRSNVLIDCGVPVRACLSALAHHNVAGRLDAVIVSHEHVDHVRSVPSITRRHDLPLVATDGTYRALRRPDGWTRALCGGRIDLPGLEVSFVGVSHDAAEPCGFVVEADGERVAIFTDLGHVTSPVLEALATADVIVLEANYDHEMLRRGSYPAHLKRRIQGPAGHLSNDDCAGALVATVSDRTRSIWLAHLSQNNNAPDVATSTVQGALYLHGLSVSVQALPRYGCADVSAAVTTQLRLAV